MADETIYERIDDLGEYIRRWRMPEEWRKKHPNAAVQEDAMYAESEAKMRAELREREQPGDWYAIWTCGEFLSARGGVALMRGDKPVYHTGTWIS